MSERTITLELNQAQLRLMISVVRAQASMSYATDLCNSDSRGTPETLLALRLLRDLLEADAIFSSLDRRPAPQLPGE